MARILISIVCGFIGGVIAVVAGVFYFYRSLPGSGYVQFSRADHAPEFYKDVEILQHDSRPQGLYVRFRNIGAKAIEMASFRVRGYKDGKLWAEFEEAVYSETGPGEEQEGILKLMDYRTGKAHDLADCRVEVNFRYGYPIAEKRA